MVDAPVKKALLFTMEGNADGEAALAFFQTRGVAVDVRDVGRDPDASLDLFAARGASACPPSSSATASSWVRVAPRGDRGASSASE